MRRSFFVVLAAALALAACPTAAGRRAGSPACTGALDCPANLSCVGGYCRSLGASSSSGTTAGGGTTGGGSSGTAGASCIAGCPPSEICVSSACVPTGSTSTSTGGSTSSGSGGSSGTGSGGSVYASAVLADAPLAYYRLDELSGSTVRDQSGNGNDGSYGAQVALGLTSLLAADPDPAAGFNGGAATLANYIVVPKSSGLEPAVALSVECWLLPQAAGSSVALLSYGDDTTSPWQPYILRLDGQQITFQLVAQGSIMALTSVAQLTLGQIYHVVGTYDGTTQSLYIDGQLDSSQPATGAITHYGASATNGLGIGHRFSSVEPVFQGTLDEVAIYGTALPAARVLAHYQTGSGPPIGASN
ncbi:MAG: LamG domain-containing protein [Deltaproteobacteria bacterium]